MAESAAVASGDLATAAQYNNLRNDVLSLTLGHRHDGTNGRVHLDGDFKLRNPADTFGYTFKTSAIVAARNVTLPLLTGNDIFVLEAFIQTLTNKTISGGTFSGTIAGTPTASGFWNYSSGIYINESANANMTVGLTINQGANDNEALALKSSDVGHGITAISETDTYGLFKKRNATAGGLLIRGVQATGFAGEAMIIQGFNVDAADTTDTSASIGVVKISGIIGTGLVADGGNLLAVDNNGTTRMVLKGNGDMHITNTTLTALDDIPDALAGRAARTYLAEPLGGLQGVRYVNRELADALERRNIIHFNREHDGVAFMNIQNAIMFSWDMGFQLMTWLGELVGILTEEQRRQLSPGFAQALTALPSIR